MLANDMFHCRVPFCQCSGAPLSSHSIHDEAKSVSNINSHNTYPPSYSPSLSAVVATSPTSGGQMDLPFKDAGNPCCMQQPPNHVIDYWFHRLGLSVQTTSAETLSKLPIVGASSNPPTGVRLFPVLGEINSRSHLGTLGIRPTPQEHPSTANSRSQIISDNLPSPTDKVEPQPSQSPRAIRHQTQIARPRQMWNQRVYDRPGRRPAAKYEPDPIKLQASCRLLGGTDYACQWITTIFSNPVTLDALVRPLELTEIANMNFLGGFEPFLAYHGFMQKSPDGFECCLCTVGKRTWWKNKKDAVRHLRKFHFGLADRCNSCTRLIYSTGEMRSHRCVPPKNTTLIISTIESESGTLGVMGNRSG